MLMGHPRRYHIHHGSVDIQRHFPRVAPTESDVYPAVRCHVLWGVRQGRLSRSPYQFWSCVIPEAMFQTEIGVRVSNDVA